MYCNYQDREEFEDDLYGEEGDSDGSEVNREVEFHLYSQLHYASETGAVNREDLQDAKEERERSVSADPEQSKDGLQEGQALKQALLKLNNLKKGKTNAKSLRSSAKLEEVIVIDSGTDIIHSEDDNEGVCTLKGQSSKRVPLSSTPAQQTRAKRPRSPSLDSVVLVNSESEESESESDDNSDILEAWMILGQGKDVEDHSISLNLEGQSSNSTDGDEAENGNWLVSSKDMATRIYNQDKSRFVRPLARRNSNRYYCDKSVTCRNCNKTGHLSMTCPSPSKVLSCSLCGTPGHLIHCCPNRHCNNCGMPGHMYKACSDMAYWHKKCHRCGMTGHFTDVCPEIWRQYHLTTKKGPAQPSGKKDQGRMPAYCYNCARSGHFGHACTQRRMYNGTYPSTPFINHYDTPADFHKREHRMKRMAKELEEAGLLGPTSNQPATPGPPKKRQRTAYNHDYKKNHHHHKQQENANSYPSSTRVPKPGSSSAPTHTRFGEAGPVQTTPRRPAVIFKTQMSTKLKPTPVSAADKQWKPKRGIPANKAAASTLNEEECFPRGGEERAPKKSRNRNKKNPNRLNWGGSAEPRTSPFKRQSYTPEQPYGGGGAAKEKGKGKRAAWKKKRSSKGGGADMYPTDENLFTIKQRKGKRK
ncbi:zinc finger CCHC domain-containing protein 7 [Gadus chalcogrammus]|uniref:zinc finger CCHC domain-containing protein 7 n=1 Tax=Gadus chalcogrammus TaxID=1042646 RepID=UPI0024C3E112|nr:zinc finger CCHC domain-containing protein 7 [Gadus chalcogrammus]XP_056441962.1 zinc finger CCHC domain-containing protein 7 [Gadus chalcogrammus]